MHVRRRFDHVSNHVTCFNMKCFMEVKLFYNIFLTKHSSKQLKNYLKSHYSHGYIVQPHFHARVRSDVNFDMGITRLGPRISGGLISEIVSDN